MLVNTNWSPACGSVADCQLAVLNQTIFDDPPPPFQMSVPARVSRGVMNTADRINRVRIKRR